MGAEYPQTSNKSGHSTACFQRPMLRARVARSPIDSRMAMRSPRRSVVVTAFALASVLAFGWGSTLRSANAGETVPLSAPEIAAGAPALETLALRGLNLQMDLCRSARPDDALAPVPARGTSAAPPQVSAREAQDKSRQCIERINSLFSGAAVKARLSAATDALPEAYADEHVRDLGAGVSSLVFTTARVGDTTATLDAKAHVWAHSLLRGDSGKWNDSLPEEDLLWHFELVKGIRGWTIDVMTGSRVDGGGP